MTAQGWTDEPRVKRSTDAYYGLTGTCVGCRRVTVLCRRDRKCGKYATKPRKGAVARPTGFYRLGDSI
jgi:hypothetical protein